MTPPLREGLEEFQSRLGKGLAGLTVYGMPDTGKSTMMSLLYERITESKKAVVYRTEMASSSTGERQLMRELAGSQQPFPSLTPKEAFVRGAQVRCEQLETPRVIILIDEAQMLTLQHLELLRGVFASLTAAGLAPFAGLFAQPEIARRRWELKHAGDVSLVNRFLGRLHQFRGLRRNEFEEVLSLFDTTRWPADGPTYTQQFGRAFWDRGGRLAQLAHSFAGEFEALSLEWGRSPDDLPVSYLNEAVHTFLAGVSTQAGSTAEINQLVHTAVRTSAAATGFEFMAGVNLRTDFADEAGSLKKPKRERIR